MLDTTRREQHKEGETATTVDYYRPGPKSKLEQNFSESLDTLRMLGAIQCTQVEAAAVLRVSERSLRRFFERYPEAVEAFDEGSREGMASLRRVQWKQAQVNPTMAIWLGKQWLGQRDKQEVSVDVTVRHENMLDRVRRLEIEGKI